jgi:Ni2+-binding GTPase involved in maturation of urease and hydrogenase
MKIHLVGGFLGSGKTTAIVNACKILSDSGIITSVITNDQGEYLVDSRFMQYSDIHSAEVTGGCFCCNYNQLDSQLNTLKDTYNPSVIFAEFVGSCTDLVATVLKPLLEYRGADNEQVTFSSFVDSQLFMMFLEDKELPFSLETKYIWEKQIEEAEVLIINKIDLLSSTELEKLKMLTKDLFPSKQLLFQNSLDNNSLNDWIEIISNESGNKLHKTIDIDYAKYGQGEANLAWLDEEIEIISSDNSSVKHAYGFIEKITDDIEQKGYAIGHLKYFLSYNGQSVKLSHTTISDKTIHDSSVDDRAMSVDLLVNARIQTSPDELRKILFDNLNWLKSLDGVQVNEKFLSYFQPGFPDPTHRIS